MNQSTPKKYVMEKIYIQNTINYEIEPASAPSSPPPPPSNTCKCGYFMKKKYQFCPKCGEKNIYFDPNKPCLMRQTHFMCNVDNCNAVVENYGDKFCWKCGNNYFESYVANISKI